MKPNEEKLIKDLRQHSNDHTPTLDPHPYFKGKFQPTFFYLDGHADLLLTVRAEQAKVTVHIDMVEVIPFFGPPICRSHHCKVILAQLSYRIQ